MVHDEITASPYPKMPLIMSEYNASYANEPNVTDTIYMGPWLATTISQCDGLTEAMSYWSFSDVFEEQGVVRTPFYGGFGLIAEDDIPKPALNAFAMLHRLGDRRIKLDSDSALATRRADGSLAVALWNYAAPYGNGAAYTPPPANRRPIENLHPQARRRSLRLRPSKSGVSTPTTATSSKPTTPWAAPHSPPATRSPNSAKQASPRHRNPHRSKTAASPSPSHRKASSSSHWRQGIA